MAINPSYVTAFSLASALGVGNDETLATLRSMRTGLRHYNMGAELGETWFGFVDETQTRKPPDEFAAFDCSCSRLSLAALHQDGFIEAVEAAKERYGSHRVGLFLGTITGGIDCLEQSYFDGSIHDRSVRVRLDQHHQAGSLINSTLFVRRYLGLTGPHATIGTACSSSAKVFATASRAIQVGLCDAAVVAGVEGVNETLLHGFRSLGVLSTQPCRPWDKNRDGINLGAAAGFALLERRPTAADNLRLLGFGETTDAYHMTAPHPQGDGVERSMRQALDCAGLTPGDIDYINVHGSGTPMNDVSEDAAIQRVFGRDTPCSSTKGWTGHTQGAAGITEALLLMMGMRENFAPASINTLDPDPKLGCRILLENEPMAIRYGLSNSLGFGGNNCTLIFGAPQ